MPLQGAVATTEAVALSIAGGSSVAPFWVVALDVAGSGVGLANTGSIGVLPLVSLAILALAA